MDEGWGISPYEEAVNVYCTRCVWPENFSWSIPVDTFAESWGTGGVYKSLLEHNEQVHQKAE